MTDRMPKINELIRQQLGQIIMKEIEFPANTILTITKVNTSADLQQSNVYISILPPENITEVFRLLIKQAGILRQELNEKVVLRKIPKLRFILDESEQKSSEIDRLLDNLK